MTKHAFGTHEDFEQQAEALFQSALARRGSRKRVLADLTAVIDMPGIPAELRARVLISRSIRRSNKDVEGQRLPLAA